MGNLELVPGSTSEPELVFIGGVESEPADEGSLDKSATLPFKMN